MQFGNRALENLERLATMGLKCGPDLFLKGHAACVIEPAVKLTVCPVVIERLFRLMSEPLVPTVKLFTFTVLPPSLMRATAAVPVLPATPDFGAPAIVMTPDASVKLGSASVIVTRTAANAAVQISMNAGAALASICRI